MNKLRLNCAPRSDLMSESSERKGKRNPPTYTDPPNLSTDAFSFIHC
ncbi:unnamed protein product [Musa acuminata subsp. malaccensis]|uniref:(wild Malaysian banana) hypothetical protein n=1 Tax=Musa acuminata subsp. malaccensis TaxID=214687 RepID=A0A804I943_MUSAM|nr:unnamed protein product [Musa acuminata subsp. malaccensis]